ncbi:putative sulfate exporter family transporter [Nocardia cyriacigeorgica]|uniref:YeiH family protein n=1 Tax=Nocardia cyriacigeorgica TaxID=135487 RepID=UPI0018957193|nr:putative sulfate exporter family transporter [Nocardia cyriacigeorgica]MBF6316979.1 putative sulfate exporter family transporter [Nocardia cyriacigeorgica]MBF6532469.1 putative sulfate exporter family transporter [Nocardia cyriacigeorgica]
MAGPEHTPKTGTADTATAAQPVRSETEALRPAAVAAPAAVVGGVLVVLLLGALTRYVETQVPNWTADTPLRRVAKTIEYPVYAIAFGLIGNVVLAKLGLRERLSAGFRTEFFIKTGVVLLGASINLKVLVTAAGPAILQALLLITAVFGFAWWLGGRVGLDDKLRALLASAVSICGVSAAIAAAGAVQAKREQIAYAASLVIIFALPSIFLLPWLAGLFGLSDAVAGEQALQIAAIVKTTQNALIGIVAIALTAYFTLRVERAAGAGRPSAREFWDRFPKFVLGFLAASIIGTLYVQAVDSGTGAGHIATVNDLRTWFLILAFVSIGLEFSLRGLRAAGARPVIVFGAAAAVNIVVGLGLSVLLFRNFTP